jgi:ABC-2 type transport system ATP-binding protein
VILSTHIVDDVSDLCSRMAIIDRGEIRLAAEPLAAIADVQGKIWMRAVDRAQLEEYQRDYPVISTKLSGGRTIVRVLSDTPPEHDFEAVHATLEDVYFAALRQPAAVAATVA